MPRAASGSNHGVPDHARARTARTPAATPGVRGEPSDAERGRTLLTGVRTGSLSTVAAEGGFPFGALVAYAVDDVGRPLLCLSDLAEHSRNLAADTRASLMATAEGAGDPLALARVTVLGSVVELRDAARDDAVHAYRDRFPDAFYAAFTDFRLYRLAVASVRYVGGFGRMSWVSADDHAAAEPDPLRPHAADIVTHMNDDHADRLVAEEGEPALRVYLLVVGALRALADRGRDASLVLDAFFLRAMAHAGWAPAITDCARCAAPGPHRAFSVGAGGAVCPRCRPPGSVTPAREPVVLMDALLHGDWTAADAATVLVAAHLQWHLERQLRSLPLVERRVGPSVASEPAADRAGVPADRAE